VSPTWNSQRIARAALIIVVATAGGWMLPHFLPAIA